MGKYRRQQSSKYLDKAILKNIYQYIKQQSFSFTSTSNSELYSL